MLWALLQTPQACEDSTVVLFSLARPTMGTAAVELGSGYGSGARYLAANFGATVECIDLSPEANSINRTLTEKAGLSKLVKVGVSATFFDTGLPSSAYGFCFSQDAMCHAGGQTPRALDEAVRLLKPGGVLACTNILRTEDATPEELEEVLVRLQLNHLETLESFVGHARAAGLELVESLDKTTSMAMHFQALIEVSGHCSRERDNKPSVVSAQNISSCMMGLSRKKIEFRLLCEKVGENARHGITVLMGRSHRRAWWQLCISCVCLLRFWLRPIVFVSSIYMLLLL